jgi:N-acetylmuramoyl-L-alanine amidase
LKLHWLFSSLIVLCLTAPAKAGQLATWKFDADQNRLEFSTDADVQPRAQLVFDPTRLVIDLPGTQVAESPVTQFIGGAIQQIRIGQFDAQTTRIVVELAPGYMLDPQQVRFRGLSPTQWTVQLPQPQRSADSTTASVTGRTTDRTTSSATNSAVNSPDPSRSTAQPESSDPPSTSARRASASSATAATGLASSQQNSVRRSDRSAEQSTAAQPAPTQINRLQVTNEGLLLETTGSKPEVSLERSRSGRSITVQLTNARLADRFGRREREIDRHGVDDLEIDQEDNTVEISLDVDRHSPDWQVQLSDRGEVLLRPEAATVASEKSADPEPPTNLRVSAVIAPTGSAPTGSAATVAEQPSPARLPALSESVPRIQLATVEGIDLDLSGNQLLIQTDRPVAHQAQWQGGMYVVSLSPARLAEQVKGPQLTPADPLRRVRLRQVDEQTVAISIQPATGIQFGSLNLITPQMLALEMQRPTATARSTAPAASSLPNSLPNLIPNGRLVVAIDPGHGGADPGAVGIGNLHEADVVFPIAQQVAALLERQGIQAILTRSSDIEVDLEPRVQMAEQAQADLFVSIHANSVGMERPEVNGTETYYYSSGEGLAEVIQSNIVSAVGTNDRGVRQARFYVLRRTSMPAVLVETGYVTGSEDAPRLSDPNFRNQMAIAIARGILQYIQQQAMAGN